MTSGNENFSEMEIVEPAMDADKISPIQVHQKLTPPWLIPLFLGTSLGIAIAFISGSAFKSGTGNQADKAAKETKSSMTVTVNPVETTSISLKLTTTGTVAARDLIPVLAQTNGLQIKQIPNNIKEGTTVEKGQVLAILDDSVLQTQISQGQADIDAKQADLKSRRADLQSKRASVTANQAIVKQRQADVTQANAALEEAERNFRRYKQLANGGVISQQELENRSFNVKTALTTINSAKAGVSSAQEIMRSTEENVLSAEEAVRSAEAAVRNSAAKVAQLKTQLAQTVVRSPVSGMIAEKLARVGDVTGVAPQTQLGTVIGGSQKLFSIIEFGQLELQAKVPQNQLVIGEHLSEGKN